MYTLLTAELTPEMVFEGVSAFMEGNLPDLFTIEQAAQYLQVSQSSIRSYIRQGKIDAYRIAGMRKVLIAKPELLKLLVPARNDHSTIDPGDD